MFFIIYRYFILLPPCGVHGIKHKVSNADEINLVRAKNKTLPIARSIIYGLWREKPAGSGLIKKIYFHSFFIFFSIKLLNATFSAVPSNPVYKELGGYLNKYQAENCRSNPHDRAFVTVCAGVAVGVIVHSGTHIIIYDIESRLTSDLYLCATRIGQYMYTMFIHDVTLLLLLFYLHPEQNIVPPSPTFQPTKRPSFNHSVSTVRSSVINVFNNSSSRSRCRTHNI